MAAVPAQFDAENADNFEDVSISSPSLMLKVT
jgi:hypothetical protein